MNFRTDLKRILGKATPETLWESEARLRTLGDNLPNGVIFQIVQEPDGRNHLTHISAGIEQMAGVPVSEAMQDFSLLTDLIMEEDRRRLQAAWRESSQSLSVFDLECRFSTRRGEVKWARFRMAPRRLPNGGTLWDGIQVDVTDTKRDLESLLQTVGAIIWEGEEDLPARTFRFTFVSQQAVVLLGYPIKDWLEQPTFWSDRLHPEDRQRVLALRHQAIAAKRDFELEYRMMANDGRTVWLRGIVKVVAENDQRLKLRGITVDITESKQAEAALRESEERLKLASIAAHVGAWDWQLSTNELKWSDEMRQIFGLANGESDVTTELFLDLIHPDDRQFVSQAIIRTIKQGVPYDVEFRTAHRDGSVHWVMGKGKALLDEAGRAVRMLGVNMDITARKQAEDALRRSEARYRAIVEDQTELICRLLPDGTLTFVNESYARYFGHTVEELVDTSFRPFIPAEEEKQIEQFMASFSPSNPVATIEHRVVLTGGELRWQQWTDRAIYDEQGRLLEFQCVGRDITVQKRMEQALCQSQRRYTLATAAGRVGLWDWNLETDDIYVDPELKALLGYRDDEVRNHLDDWGSRVHPEDQEAVMAAAQSHLEGRAPSFEVEHRMVRKDGAVCWFLARGTLVEGEDGNRHIIGTDTDITERKQAEEQLLNIAKGVSATTGENFFRSLVEHLARALGADYAFAGELMEGHEGRIRTIAARADGQAVENFEYDLAETPCANVVGQTLCSYPSGVQQAFPRDYLLAEMGVEGYVGTPLFDSAGHPLGLMVVLCRQPIGNSTLAESMLQIFAARASAEMERKQTEESLHKSHRRIQDLAGRLIFAQEEERKYIARELHDDLNQQVAALAIGISRLKRQLLDTDRAGADQAVHDQIARLQEKTDWLSERIRRVSHELHSSILQHVGLAAALKAYCAEFAEQEGIAVALDLQDQLEAIPEDAALCLYRVVQESLRNIARHSGATSAEVKLANGRGTLELRVSDRGVGFDPKQPGARHGLGLVGIEERVRLLRGNFHLKTQPGAGTELTVQIPLRSEP